jgi:mono/diheme cytochrome c family protein
MKNTVRNFLSICLFCGAAALATTGAQAADAAAGKAVYAAKCKTCHGAEGVPPAGLAKALGIKPFSDPTIQAKSDADLKAAVTNGVGKMKPISSVTGADLDNVIAAVRALK